MKTLLFDFKLPPELIAHYPISPRDAARMLMVDKMICDKMIIDLPDILRAGDIMVFNDTKVIPAQLEGKRGEVRIAFNLHKYNGGNIWQAFAKPGKRLKVGNIIIFYNRYKAIVKQKYDNGIIDLEWHDNWQECINLYGKMPLPLYINRDEELSDKQSYQTVYAKNEGAVAAPTAGLHFTNELLSNLRAKGINFAYVTLHVGAGTFLPVKVDDTQEHEMHSEYIEITEDVAASINAARKSGGRVIAVGTTSLRVLESVVLESGVIQSYHGETKIFITPGYRFKAVDILVTNFHLPKSTLFMLVSAFCSLEIMKRAYQHAIDHKYRFYSYGDACLLFRA